MKNLKELLSITLSAALALTSAPWPVSAAGPMDASEPAFVKAFTPAEQIGYVASSYAPSSDVQRPRLIVIADLHGHIGVQKNIVSMLDSFVSKLTSNTSGSAEQRVPIYVEGGWQDHLEHPLNSIKNPKVRSVFAEYLLQKAEMPAAQAFSERHPDASNFKLTGVENEKQYQENRARFVETYPVRKVLLEAIARQEQTMANLSDRIEPSTYQYLQTMRLGYERGGVTTERYARVLVHYAGRFAIQDPSVDVLRHVNGSSSNAVELALTKVHRLVLSRVSESRPISSYFRKSIDQENVVRKNLAFADSYLDLLKRVLGDQLTPEEVPQALVALPRLVQVANALLAGEKLNINVHDAIQQSLDFYAYAFMRDDSLIQNSLTALNQDDTHALTGILVVGGFHIGSITDYLREQQIPFVQINPVVDRDLTTVEELNYVKRVCDEHITPAEVKNDMTHPWGQDLIRRETSAAPVSDLVQPEITPKGNGATDPSVVKPVSDEVDPNGGKGGAFAAGPVAVINGFVVQGTPEGLKHFLPGQLTTQVAADEAHAADIQNLADGIKHAQIFANIVDPTQGELFDITPSGAALAEGSKGELFQEIVDAAVNSFATAEKNEKLTQIEVQLVNGPIQTKNLQGDVIREDNIAIIKTTGGRHVILVNKTKDEIKTINATLNTLPKASELAPNAQPTEAQSKAASFVADMFHEVGHAVTARGSLGDAEHDYVNSLSIPAAAAYTGAKMGIESSALPVPFVPFFLNAAESALPSAVTEARDTTEIDNAATIPLLASEISEVLAPLAPGVAETKLAGELRDLGVPEDEIPAEIANAGFIARSTGNLPPSEKRSVSQRMKAKLEELAAA